jgi:thiamine biosynthesis lipoprotein
MKALALCLSFSLCAACTQAPDAVKISGNTMGTQFNVTLASNDADVDFLQQEIEASLDAVDRMMSTYKADSEISRFSSNATTEWQQVSAEFCASVENALGLSALTNGAFDITVGPLVNLWGFGPGDTVDEPPADADIAALLLLVGYEHLQADCSRPALKKDIIELALDMSAFGKGYAADRVADWLDDAGIGDYLVEVGGELRVAGHNADGKMWSVGIEAPLTDQRRPHTIIRLTDAAVATSGDYRNYFESAGQRYSHTIDTRTGRPVSHSLVSVTVVDSNGYRADALATALLVMGPENAMALALKEKLAALFLLRNDAGIEELTTPAFDQLRSS